MNIHKFLTIYVFLLVLYGRYTSKYVDLVLLSGVVALVGGFISWVHPQTLDINFGQTLKLQTTPSETRLFDLFFHQIPFIYALTTHLEDHMSITKVITSLLLLSIYLTLVDINAQYGIHKIHIDTLLIAPVFWTVFYIAIRILSTY